MADQLIDDSLQTDFNYEILCVPDQDRGHMPGVTGQQEMFTPSKHITATLLCQGVHIYPSLDFVTFVRLATIH